MIALHLINLYLCRLSTVSFFQTSPQVYSQFTEKLTFRVRNILEMKQRQYVHG